MKRDYNRIRNAIKATNKKFNIEDWLMTYREVLYDLLLHKTAICDLENEVKNLKKLLKK